LIHNRVQISHRLILVSKALMTLKLLNPHYSHWNLIYETISRKT